MTRQGKKEMVRLHLEMPKRVNDIILGLQRRADCASRSEVIRRALALFDCVLTYQEKGSAFIVRHDGEERELEIVTKGTPPDD